VVAGKIGGNQRRDGGSGTELASLQADPDGGGGGSYRRSSRLGLQAPSAGRAQLRWWAFSPLGPGLETSESIFCCQGG